MVTAPEKDFEKDIEALRADIAALTNTVGSLASQAAKAEAGFARNVRKAVKGAASTGEDIWDEGVQLGQDAARAAVDGAHAGVSGLEDHIKKNPMNAVLIALGVGFLVGIVGHK